MTTPQTTTPQAPKAPKQLRVRSARPKSHVGPKLTPKWRPARSCLERELPQGWEQLALPAGASIIDNGRVFRGMNGNLQVIESIGVELDGKRWQHVSVERNGARTPSWDDLVLVKRLFAGHDTTMLQIVPPSMKHVSIHDRVLHLWRCLDGDVTPDFTRGQRQV